MDRRLILTSVLALLLAAGIGFWWWQRRAPAGTVWQGYAEAYFVKVGPVDPGVLASVSVARGDKIETGAPLFAQDDTNESAARDQAAHQLAQAQQQLANLEAGGKPTEIDQAEANLADSRATLARTQADLRRGEAQIKFGGVSQETVDQLRADNQSAQAK